MRYLRRPKHGIRVPLSGWLRRSLHRRLKELRLDLPKAHFDRQQTVSL